MTSRSLLITRTPAPLRNQVVERLRTAICEQHLPQGARLIERQLCEMLGVSRTLVREALRQLEAEGLVVIIPHRGPSVATLDATTVRGIYEVRAVLEALAGDLFVRRATASDRQRLRAAHEAGARAHTREVAATLRATTRFYDAMFAGARNETIAAVLRPLGGRITLLRARSLSIPGRREEARAEMEGIYAALIGDDPMLAWERCRRHVETAAVYALQSFEEKASFLERCGEVAVTL